MKLITKCSGGSDGRHDYYDDIMEFNPTSREWTVVDNMMKARDFHAISVIKADNVIQFCS